MYLHIDGRICPDNWPRYSIARVGIAVCDTVDGDYQFVTSFRPLKCESRDIGQFSTTRARLISSSKTARMQAFHISRLSEVCMTVEKNMSFMPLASKAERW